MVGCKAAICGSLSRKGISDEVMPEQRQMEWENVLCGYMVEECSRQREWQIAKTLRQECVFNTCMRDSVVGTQRV